MTAEQPEHSPDVGGPNEKDDMDSSAADEAADAPDGFDGSAAETAAGPPPDDVPVEPTGPSIEDQLAERTADLQRLQAEYVNYKRRVDRDRDLVRAQGVTKVLDSLLTVLDDVRRADEHGELVGGFKAVADSLHSALDSHGLESFGAEGDPFDPELHEAVHHAGTSSNATVTIIDKVFRVGYRAQGRVLRAATVSVLDPEPESTTKDAAASDEDSDAGAQGQRENGAESSANE